MTLNQPLIYFVWSEEYCQTSPNKNKSPNLWHVVTSILVCCIFDESYLDDANCEVFPYPQENLKAHQQMPTKDSSTSLDSKKCKFKTWRCSVLSLLMSLTWEYSVLTLKPMYPRALRITMHAHSKRMPWEGFHSESCFILFGNLLWK